MKLADDPSAHARVFISYRRSGAASHAGQIAAALSARLPEAVFYDPQIKAGENFLEAIQRRLDVCDVLVAVIHPGWNVVDVDDFVGLELRTAVARGLNIVPVLVDGARMPTAQELPAELAVLAGCSPIDVDSADLLPRVDERLRAAEERRTTLCSCFTDHRGNLCWSSVLRGEHDVVYAALLACMVREHRAKWVDTAPEHEITLLRRRLTHVAHLTVRLKPGTEARTTVVEMAAEPSLRGELERTIARVVATRRS